MFIGKYANPFDLLHLFLRQESMFSHLWNKRKYWFTLIELLLVCSVFAILVSWVIVAINRAYTFMNNSRVKIRATNFTREWVEMMFNIRDTNRRKYSWEKDKYRLNLWTGEENQIGKWIYVIKEDRNENGDIYFYLYWVDVSADNVEYFYSNWWFWDESYEDQRLAAKIELNWNYNYMKYSSGDRVPQTWSIQELLADETDFYRIVRVFGVYCKNVSNSDNTTSCLNDSDPKEMRFCVKTFYKLWAWTHSSELCSIMTNFMK